MPRIEPIPWEELSDAERSMMQAGNESGAYRLTLPLQILAYADHDHLPDTDRHPNFPRHLLDARLLELLRIRSAQLGGCEPCMGSRKHSSITDHEVACLRTPGEREELTERETRALEFLDLLATDHFSIDDDTYRQLAEVFTTAEIIELGNTCGSMIGTHRFIHTLDPLGEQEPVIRYERSQVGVTWDEQHADTR